MPESKPVQLKKRLEPKSVDSVIETDAKGSPTKIRKSFVPEKPEYDKKGNVIVPEGYHVAFVPRRGKCVQKHDEVVTVTPPKEDK
jgi:hypothetical protein